MKKTLVGFAAVGLLVPAAVFAAIDCGATGCADEYLVHVSSDPTQSTENRIQALQQLVATLLAKIAQIKSGGVAPSSTAKSWCFVPTYDLYIGRTDAQTNGEVKKLQLWLKSEGYFPEAQGTGYYGELTAAAVVRWQKAHGMDFVTPQHGVGKQTRAKMQEACGKTTTAAPKMWWGIEKANPAAPIDTVEGSQQEIFAYVGVGEVNIKRYSVGKAHGCTDKKTTTLWDGTPILGLVSCYYALSGVAFTAYDRNGKIVIERHDDDASGRTSGTKTVVLEI